MNDQDNDFNNNKLISLDKVTLKRNPFLDEEAVKKIVDGILTEDTVLRYIATL